MEPGVNRQNKVKPGEKLKWKKMEPGVKRQDKVNPGEKWNQE